MTRLDDQEGCFWCAGVGGSSQIAISQRGKIKQRNPNQTLNLKNPKFRKPCRLQEEHEKTGKAIGLDVYGGGAMLPEDQGIWDNYTVKKHFIMLSTVIASQLLLVDEVMRAGRNMKRSGPGGH